MKKMISLSAILLSLCIFTSCSPKISYLSRQDIKDVKIRTHTGSRELTEDEISEFIGLYNSSSYGERKTGQGGTPDFNLHFTLIEKDIDIGLNDFYGKLEPYGTGIERYIESIELYEFIKNLSKTVE